MDPSRVIAAVLVVFSLITAANAANILCLMGAATPTNQIRSHELFKTLAARGHKLTVLGESKYIVKLYGIKGLKGPNNNILYRPMNTPSSAIPAEYDKPKLMGAFEKTVLWNDRQWNICNEMLSTHNFHAMIKWSQGQTRPFDLIIYDIVHAPDCLLSLAQLFDKASPEDEEIPLVAMNIDAKTIQETFEVARGGLINYAILPFFLSNFNEDMFKVQAYFNMMLYGYSYITRCLTIGADIIHMTRQHPHLQKFNVTFNYATIQKRIKIVLVNTHPLLNFEQPLPPNVIEVAGFQITHPKELPQSLLDNYVEKLNSGIIFMSFGNSFQINAPEEQKRVRDILKVVRLLPDFLFLWKVEKGETITNPPDNLYLSRYLSENDVLAHRRTKIFITVAEVMHLQEAIHYGVPMIVVPLLIDQLNLARRIHDRGYGRVFHFEVGYFSGYKLHEILTGVLKNYNNYKIVAKRLQTHFRNESQPPMDKVVWYIEALLTNPDRFDNLSEGGQPSFFIFHFFDVIVPFGFYFFVVLWFNFVFFHFCVVSRIVSVVLFGYKHAMNVFARETEDFESDSEDVASESEEPEDVESDSEDVASESEDVASEPKDVVSEGVASQPEGVASQPEGVASEPEGVASQPEGIASEPKGVAAQPEGIASEPKRVAAQPEGIASEPKGVAAQPEGIASEPKGVAAQPEGIASEPEGVAAQPDDVASELDDTAPEPEDVASKLDDIIPESEVIYSVQKINEPETETEVIASKPEDTASKSKLIALEPEAICGQSKAKAPKATKAKNVAPVPEVKCTQSSANAHNPGAVGYVEPELYDLATTQYWLDNGPSSVKLVLHPQLPPNSPPQKPQSDWVHPKKKKKGRRGRKRK